jgi:hypothetical protein
MQVGTAVAGLENTDLQLLLCKKLKATRTVPSKARV